MQPSSLLISDQPYLVISFGEFALWAGQENIRKLQARCESADALRYYKQQIQVSGPTLKNVLNRQLVTKLLWKESVCPFLSIAHEV